MATQRDLVLAKLSELAPQELAEPWDNVGLLVDPGGQKEFTRAFVTIDLTPTTMEEAEEYGADLIVSYHPPIFSGLKRLRAGQVGETLIVRALRGGITIYSPHTALDAAVDGMNDWLAEALGPGTVTPIVPSETVANAGAGRMVTLEHLVSLEEAVSKVKAHLGLSHVRVSEAFDGRPIQTLAVCPGAGGSLFEKVGVVDLLLTGEMRHHDVLGRKQRGTHVIVTDHTNTERGYLPVFARRLKELCPGLEVSVSRADADPLRVV